MKLVRLMGVFVGMLVLAGWSKAGMPPAADALYVNGRIYTVDAGHPWAEAVAIRDKRFVFVGTSRAARRYIGPSTQVVDLHGQMAMPGIHDAHTHLLWAGLAANYGCMLPSGSFGNAHIAALRECAKSMQPDEWLVAAQFAAGQFPDNHPDRKYLDTAFPDRPVYLVELTQHNGLANSRALKLAGIDESSPDPPGGVIVRSPEGRVTGELIETATTPIRKLIPAQSPDHLRKALEWAVRTCNRFGITSVQDASGDEALLRTLRDLEQSGSLTMDVAVHLMWGSSTFQRANDAEVEALLDHRGTYRSAHVDVDNVKIFIDGAPIPPYYTEAGIDPVTHSPDLRHVLVAPETLRNAVRRFDAAGLRVKMHVAGAGAAHVALDAIDAARSNPGSTRRHELAHTNLILPEDMDRMHELNVTGEMSPAVWQLYGGLLGNPPQKAWQFRSLAARNVMMTVGTDWAVMAEPNLFPSLQGVLAFGDESIDLPLAIRMYTLNGAIAGGVDRQRGSIEVGKHADFIVLDRNIVEGPAASIGAATVLKTVFEGRVVYSAGAE